MPKSIKEEIDSVEALYIKKFGTGDLEESKEKAHIAKKVEKIRHKLNTCVNRVVSELYKLS